MCHQTSKLQRIFFLEPHDSVPILSISQNPTPSSYKKNCRELLPWGSWLWRRPRQPRAAAGSPVINIIKVMMMMVMMMMMTMMMMVMVMTITMMVMTALKKNNHGKHQDFCYCRLSLSLSVQSKASSGPMWRAS